MNKEQDNKQSDLVKRLREQVHKSFMQISEMQKLFHLELQHTKQEFDQREKEMKKRQEQIRQKYQQIENNFRSNENFIIDLGDLDMSLDEIAYKKQSSLRDSGIDTIKQMLDAEKKMFDPQIQISKLQQLQTSITSIITNPPAALFQLFKISNQMCIDNCRLRQQLLNSQQTSDYYNAKILQSQRIIEKFKRGEKNLQKHNQQLNDLYVQQASQNARVQQQMRLIKQELIAKKIENQQLKIKVTMLSDLLKSPSKLDLDKITFKSSTNFLDQCKKPPASMRMSSNAVLFRPKAITPTNLVSSHQQNNNVSLPTQQHTQKYFKRKTFHTKKD